MVDLRCWKAYAVLVQDVKDDAELAKIGAVVNEGNAANLNKARERLHRCDEFERNRSRMTGSALGPTGRGLGVARARTMSRR